MYVNNVHGRVKYSESVGGMLTCAFAKLARLKGDIYVRPHSPANTWC